MMDLGHFLKDTCVTYLILSYHYYLHVISLLPPHHISIASTLVIRFLYLISPVAV